MNPVHATFRFQRTLFTILACLLVAACASPALQYAPESGKGPAIVMISGQSGTHTYRWIAMSAAKLGYTVFLIPGQDVRIKQADSEANLRKTIQESQADRRVVPGKVVVIGFSLGGGGALVYATALAEQVSGVVAYYPNITPLSNIPEIAARVTVPTLVLAGEKDSYFHCCMIESMRAFDAAARAARAPFELVSYPDADHNFNLEGNSRFRAADSADAWARTTAFLAKVHPVK